MHEWMVWACFSESTKYEQLIFFTLHGVLAILEVTFKRLLRSSTGFDYNKRVPWILQLLGTQVLLAFISPFFLNQMVREQTYFRLGFAATQ